MKKNRAIWFGIAQMRKCNKQMNENEINLQKNRLKYFEKLIDRREKNSQTYDNYNWSPDMLWLFDLDEILAHDLPLRLLLATASNFAIALEINSSHIFGRNQRNNIKTNREINVKLYYDWFLRPPLAASIYFVDALEYVMNQHKIKETPTKSTLKALDLSLGARKRAAGNGILLNSQVTLCEATGTLVPRHCPQFMPMACSMESHPHRVLDSVRMAVGEGVPFAPGNVSRPLREPAGEGAASASGNFLSCTKARKANKRETQE